MVPKPHKGSPKMTKATATHSIELDIVDEGCFLDTLTPGADITHLLNQFLDDDLATLVEGLATRVELVDPCGPGGGNPVVRFWGTQEGVARISRLWSDLEDGAILELALGWHLLGAM